MNFQAFYYVFHKIIKWGDILSRDAFLSLLACNKDKKMSPHIMYVLYLLHKTFWKFRKKKKKKKKK